MSPVLCMISFLVLRLPSTTAPNGTESLSNVISIPWQEPVTIKIGWDMSAHSNITYNVDIVNQGITGHTRHNNWIRSQNSLFSGTG